TSTMKLKLGTEKMNHTVKAYANADWATNHNRKSIIMVCSLGMIPIMPPMMSHKLCLKITPPHLCPAIA
ncbi:hypothetical protein HK096_011334, partial [Nowakowskiella sp. JEL0078]